MTDKFNHFKLLFRKWNASINLSAARSSGEIDEHITDSRQVVSLLRGAKRVLDVGSGGGFPVVLAAIELPDTEFVALEPVHKKHAFLRTAARELGLANLDAHAARLDGHDGRDYDVAMSRATFDLRDWLELGTPFVVVGGCVIGFEGVLRNDLPASIERIPYGREKQRALVRLRRIV